MIKMLENTIALAPAKQAGSTWSALKAKVLLLLLTTKPRSPSDRTSPTLSGVSTTPLRTM